MSQPNPLSRRTLLGLLAAGSVAGCSKVGSPSSGDQSKGDQSRGDQTGGSQPGSTASPSAGQGSPSGSPRAETPSAPDPSASDKGPARTLTTVMSGDLLWHNTLWMSAAKDHERTGRGDTYDFDPMFASIKPVIAGADLAIAHNEVPFAKPGQKPTGYPEFAAPRQIAPWMASMGWDLATADSNHSIDGGFEGLRQTHELLTSNGITVSGTHLTKDSADRATMIERKGVKVAIVGGTYDLNGLKAPSAQPWCVDLWDVNRMLRLAEQARKDGADIVLAHLHGGEEYQTAPNPAQVTRAKALAAHPDIDLVFGEHVHVVQPITRIGSTWVVYGMGNMVAQHSTNQPSTYDGATVRFTWQEAAEPLPGKHGHFRVVRAEYLPTMITSYLRDGRAVLYDVNRALREHQGPTERLQTTRARVRKAITSLGQQPDLVEVV